MWLQSTLQKTDTNVCKTCSCSLGQTSQLLSAISNWSYSDLDPDSDLDQPSIAGRISAELAKFLSNPVSCTVHVLQTFSVTSVRHHESSMNLQTCDRKVSPARHPEFTVGFRIWLEQFH